MGFGGGGFNSSPSNVAGSTIAGTNKDTDVHQFTGSVDITGSLEINGVQITTNGGGGGATSPGGSNTQVQFNNAGSFAGSANMVFDGTSLTATQVTASTSMKAATLQVSSSAEGALFRVDHSTQAGSKPILFITGSGLVGIGTAAPRTDSPPASGPSPGDDTNRVHILGESGTDQGQDPVINTVLMLENNDHVGIQFMMPNQKAGQITWGTADAQRKATYYYDSNYNKYCWEGLTYGTSKVMDVAVGGDCVNIGSKNALHMQGAGSAKANLHISSSTTGVDKGGPVLLRIDHGSQSKPILFVTGSGRVGIGTESPVAPLSVVGDANISEGILTISGSTDETYLKIQGDADVGIRLVADVDGAGGENDNPYIDFYQDGGNGTNRAFRQGTVGLVGDAGEVFDNSLGNAFYIMAAYSTNYDNAFQIATRRNTDDQRAARITIDPVNAFTGINTNAPTALLHVSSSVEGQNLFQVDAVSQNAQGFTVVDSGSAVYATINKTAQSSYALDVGGTTRSNQLISTVDGTSYGFKVGQDLHHIYSDAGTLTVDAKNNNNVVITTGSTGRVGVGTTSPTAKLHVSSSVDAKTLSPFSIQCRGSGSGGETANDFMFCVTGSAVNQNTVYVGALSGESITQYADLQVDQNIWLNDGHLYMQGGNPSVRTSNSQQKFAFNTDDDTLDLVNGNTTRVRVSNTLMSSSVAFSSTGMISTANNVEATGSVKGGLFGGTSIETLTSNGAISATTSTTILNLTGQSNNTTYMFTIADGTFTGQEKKIYAMATSGSSGPASNGVMISGANIRSKATNGILMLSGSMQNFGGGPVWYFVDPQAGASLVWDSAKWLIVGNNNFTISSS